MLEGMMLPIIIVVFLISICLSPLAFGYFLEKKERREIRLDKLNKLYECPKCKRYHREYQETIKRLSDENYKKVESGMYCFEDGKLVGLSFPRSSYASNVCPHCFNNITFMVTETYGWEDYHEDCVKLSEKGYKTYEKTLIEINRLAYEQRSIDKFIEKNNLNIKGEVNNG